MNENQRIRITQLLSLLVLMLLGSASPIYAQRSSLFQAEPPAGERPPATLRESSWTYIPMPPPEPIRLHDIIVVRVDKLSRMQAEGEMERRKTALYDAILKDWLRFDGLDSLKPATQSGGDPSVEGSLNQQYRSEGEMETRESLTFSMAAEIVDIRPNGTLVIEGHEEARINGELWLLSISGICSPDKIGPDKVVLSRDLLHLKIDKREVGHVRDSYRRGWLVHWLDHFHPF